MNSGRLDVQRRHLTLTCVVDGTGGETTNPRGGKLLVK